MVIKQNISSISINHLGEYTYVFANLLEGHKIVALLSEGTHLEYTDTSSMCVFSSMGNTTSFEPEQLTRQGFMDIFGNVSKSIIYL